MGGREDWREGGREEGGEDWREGGREGWRSDKWEGGKGKRALVEC